LSKNYDDYIEGWDVLLEGWDVLLATANIGGYRSHYVHDTGIFKRNFYHCGGYGNLYEFC